MTRTKDFCTIGFIAGMLLSMLICPLQVQAAPISHEEFSTISNPTFSRLKELVFNASSDDFAGDERPGNRTSGGSRGPCLDQLIVLVPGTEAISVEADTCETQSNSLPVRTLDDTPTFWFYIPAPSQASSRSSIEAEFVLLDKDGQILHSEQMALPETNGIVAVHLTQSLALNQSYQWIFSILINSRNPSQNPTVDGWVRRVEVDPALNYDLAQATTESARITTYANHGIWQDALTALALLRQTEPNNPALLTDWNDLLNSVGLGAIANVPLLD
jgi:hypothetical protein